MLQEHPSYYYVCSFLPSLQEEQIMKTVGHRSVRILEEKSFKFYSLMTQIAVCGQLSYNGTTGTFHSPYYPENYNRDNLDCRYLIDVSEVGSSRILLAFADFATESSADYVEVYYCSISFAVQIISCFISGL